MVNLTENMIEGKENLIDDDAHILLNLKSFSFSIAINKLNSITFDLEGRMLGAFLNGRNYRRGLDNRVLKKWSAYENKRRRRFREIISVKERENLFQLIQYILNKISSNKKTLQFEIPGDTKRTWQLLEECLKFDSTRLKEDAERFKEIYKPVSILPPDQYYSLVLQITEGCSYNKCTFCNFYNDRLFRIKNVEQVERHIQDVNKYFGAGLLLRKSIFLADANALIISQNKLLEILRRIHTNYTIVADESRSREILERRREGEIIFNGIYSFIDLFTGEYKSRREFQEMAELGVKRVYIGMESGSESLLDFLNKPGSQEEMVSAVNKIKSAGIDVGVIVLIGAGGEKYFETHINDTIHVLNQMHLDKNDFIYFSEYYPQGDTEYVETIEKERIVPLGYEKMEQQKSKIKEGLNLTEYSSPPKISEYDIREFLY
ncbi:MAG: radical SAM protein [Candidatus Marinimicrobia bacterium]|nr:radical SAM protein [Candidatus Neomarinimicrobiota bacterium]